MIFIQDKQHAHSVSGEFLFYFNAIEAWFLALVMPKISKQKNHSHIHISDCDDPGTVRMVTSKFWINPVLDLKTSYWKLKTWKLDKKSTFLNHETLSKSPRSKFTISIKIKPNNHRMALSYFKHYLASSRTRSKRITLPGQPRRFG